LLALGSSSWQSIAWAELYSGKEELRYSVVLVKGFTRWRSGAVRCLDEHGRAEQVKWKGESSEEDQGNLASMITHERRG
jgi:hypothetical protein